jgi:hypothetical protein
MFKDDLLLGLLRLISPWWKCYVKFSTRMHGGESVKINRYHLKATGAASKQLEPLQSNWSRFKATGAASKQLEPLQTN